MLPHEANTLIMIILEKSNLANIQDKDLHEF